MLPRFRVDAVGDAEEALSALERSEYAALVVDACLRRSGEDRSGLTLVQQLRARGCASGIVLVSGIIVESLEDEAQRVGADAMLHKIDYDGPSLRAAIERAIAARRGRVAALEAIAGDDPPLPDELHKLAQDVLDTFAKERAVEAEQAYRLALLAKAAFLHKSARGSAIAACARAVGLSRQTLQPYAIVATRWSAPELKQLLAERRNVRGEPISISHLVLLAKLPRATRDTWIERAFAEGLTVRQLRDLLRGVPREEA